ncbi:hypothetical protein KKB64_01640 [Patescibacteria group bacterium]|nr:hypothetical protein [Patescibacteria group bacterium]MBU1472473.1 hypothetical protein [Patescibacteria group bacterium]MBU2460287.1 hypothetical protein [Patescibacteria group bacterium]MBU2543855.1 hypothetical protein [Patescibacteria group bacterium]
MSFYGVEQIEKLRDQYEDASPEEKRAMEIRDLGYPLTRDEINRDKITVEIFLDVLDTLQEGFTVKLSQSAPDAEITCDVKRKMGE